MSPRIVVDPITRIEGHLRIEAGLDATNTITEAYSSGTMVRGIEKILIGRDPRDAWAFTQRACGVCTTVHAIASIRAVEDALGHQDPEGGQHPPEHDHRPAVHPRPCHALLHPPCPGFRGRCQRPEGRSQEDLRDPAVHLRLAELLAGLFRRRPEEGQRYRRERPAVPLLQRLLGPSGLQAAPGDQPPGRGPLPGMHRLAVPGRQDPYHPRRQEPPPQLPRRRRAHAHRHEQRPGPERGTLVDHRRFDQEAQRLHRHGLPARPPGRRPLLPRVCLPRRGPGQFPDLGRVPDGRRGRPGEVRRAAGGHPGPRYQECHRPRSRATPPR